MRETSLRHIKATQKDVTEFWEVRQEFLRLGKSVHVYAFGFSRKDALQRFEIAKYWADQPDAQPFKALFDILWDAAGSIDSLIQFLGKNHNSLRRKP